MKKYITIIIISLVALFTSCKKMESFQVNPNQPSQSPPSLLLTYLCEQVFQQDPSIVGRAARYVTFYEVPDKYVTYNWGQGDYTDYGNLRQVLLMEQEAKRVEVPNYLALGKFFRAYYFINLTNSFGDVPYSQALQAQNNLQPVYDGQEQVMDSCLQLLDNANNELSADKGAIDGDIIYNGNIQQWKSLINAFRLRVLISLSKKTGGSKIDVINQFRQIIDNPSQYPLMQGMQDNGQLVFHDINGNRYPDYNYRSMQTLYSMEKGFVDTLKKYKDERLFKFALPINGTPSAQGTTSPRFQDYAGVDAGLSLTEQVSASNTASYIAKRYYTDPVNEPYIMIGYPEQEFNIAEAIERGWISGDAATHYYNGIRASMKFYSIDDATINNYFNETNVKYNPATGLKQILVQKYIASFFNSGWQPFYEQRRTGIPVFDVGLGTSNNGQVPKRWQYPQGEIDNNNINLTEAIQRQYPNGDNINGIMWLIK